MIKPTNNEKDVCVTTRVATGFRAGCHHVKCKCGVKQKTVIKNGQ